MEHVHRRRFLGRARNFLTPLAASVTPPSALAGTLDSTKFQGAAAREYGSPSPFEKIKRWIAPSRYPTSSASWTPVGELHGVITPSAVRYERHHGGVPEINPDEHQLLVHGLVERPLVFSMEELRRFLAVHRICFLECSGNSYSEWTGPGGQQRAANPRPNLVYELEGSRAENRAA